MERLDNDNFNSNIASLIRLVLEQQKGIRDLVEDITKDIEELRHSNSEFSVIKTKFDIINKEFDNEKRIRSDCQRSVDARLTDISNKREKITDKLSFLENELNKTIRDIEVRLRAEFESKIECKTKSLSDSIKETQTDIKALNKSVAFDSGKYGGIVSIIITIVMFLMKAIWDHVVKK